MHRVLCHLHWQNEEPPRKMSTTQKLCKIIQPQAQRCCGAPWGRWLSHRLCKRPHHKCWDELLPAAFYKVMAYSKAPENVNRSTGMLPSFCVNGLSHLAKKLKKKTTTAEGRRSLSCCPLPVNCRPWRKNWASFETSGPRYRISLAILFDFLMCSGTPNANLAMCGIDQSRVIDGQCVWYGKS